jgi:hypothetical protein
MPLQGSFSDKGYAYILPKIEHTDLGSHGPGIKVVVKSIEIDQSSKKSHEVLVKKVSREPKSSLVHKLYCQNTQNDSQNTNRSPKSLAASLNEE